MAKTPDELSPLSKILFGAIDECVENRGFQYPITIAAVGSNGSLMAAVFAPGTADMIAEHVVGRGLKFPVNVMFCDSQGEAARAVIDRNSTTFH